MKSIFISIIALTALSATSQVKFEKVALSESATIHFPSKPLERSGANSKTFTYTNTDSTASFSVVVIDLHASNGVNAENLKLAMETEEFWLNAKNSLLKKASDKIKIVKEEMTNIQTLKAMYLELEKTDEKGSTNYVSIYMTVHGTTGYNIIFNNRGGKADGSLKEQFFHSFEVNIN